MKTLRLGLFAVCGVGLAWVAVAQQNPMREGRWEVTMELGMAGTPVKMPPMTTTQCVTKDQINDPSRAIPTAPGSQANDCKVSDYRVTGNKVAWKMACSKPEPLSGSGELSFTGESAYTGVVTMTMPQGDMTMKLSGKRLGDCTP